MASRELISRYKLYKSKTRDLLYWLTKTAATHADLKAIIKSLSTLPAASSAQRATQTPELELKTTELVKLAEVIRLADPPAEVPEGIILIVQDIIVGREECAEWYSAQALEEGGRIEKENETHRYFILVLRRILGILKDARARVSGTEARSGSGSVPKTRKGKSKAKDRTLGGIFDSLTLEEPALDPLGKVPPTATASTGAQPGQVTFKLENEDEDAAFEVWCFLQDLAEVRTTVKEAWIEYSHGDISFLAASSLTDTAFGLLRRADEEFTKNGPLEDTNFQMIISFTGICWFTRGSTVWMCPDPDRATKTPRMPNSHINIVELLCPVAVLVLVGYREEVSAFCKTVQHSPGGQQQCINDKTPDAGPAHGYHEFARVLSDLIPEIHKLAHPKCSCAAKAIKDDFVQGLIDLHRTGKMPMWLVLACQIYLDLYDFVGKNFVHGVEVISETFQRTERLAADLVQYNEVFHDRVLDNSPDLKKLEGASRAATRFHKASESPEGVAAATSSAQSQVNHGAVLAVTQMEKSLPGYAGVILLDLKVGIHGVGRRNANRCSLVLTMAHLYKGLRSMGALKMDWHDADFVISSFGTKKPLVMKSTGAYDGEAAVRHYFMALGMSAQDFALVSRPRRHKLRQARSIDVTSPLLRELEQRQLDWANGGLGKSRGQIVESLLHALAAEGVVADNRNRTTHSHLRDSFTPAHLLATFKKQLLHDEPLLNFDFVSFTLTCARLLKDLQARLAPLVGLQVASDDPCYFSLVSRVLYSAPGSKVVAEAVGVLQAYIETKGKTLVKEAYNQSSGRIPKHLHPVIQADDDARQV